MKIAGMYIHIWLMLDKQLQLVFISIIIKNNHTHMPTYTPTHTHTQKHKPKKCSVEGRRMRQQIYVNYI